MIELWHQDAKSQLAYREEFEPQVVELMMMQNFDLQRWDRAVELAQHLEVLLNDRDVRGDMLYKIGVVYYKAALSKDIYK